MRKLRLDPDTLAVESFQPAALRVPAGTVHGRDDGPSAPNDCATADATCAVSCDPCATCDTSCAGGPFCDCLPSGCESCLTSCAAGPFCDCAPGATRACVD